MNAERRKLIADAKGMIEQARDEEQDYLDNMPESIRAGDKGDAVEDTLENLETAIDALDALDAIA